MLIIVFFLVISVWLCGLSGVICFRSVVSGFCGWVVGMLCSGSVMLFMLVVLCWLGVILCSCCNVIRFVIDLF